MLNVDLLRDALEISTVTYDTRRMNAFIHEVVKEISAPVTVRDHDGSIYITKGTPRQGEAYPCVVAHTDTVHYFVPWFDVVERGGKLYGCDRSVPMRGKGSIDGFERVGVGGDDKVGIALALQLLMELPVLKVVFFRDEEVGCKGSYRADLDFFADCGFILEADRQGTREVTSSILGLPMYGDDFAAVIAPVLAAHRVTEVDGGMTDVYALRDMGVLQAAMNIACGYHRPHSPNEYVVIAEVEATLFLMRDIIAAAGGRFYLDDLALMEMYDYDNEEGAYQTDPSSWYLEYGQDDETKTARSPYLAFANQEEK